MSRKPYLVLVVIVLAIALYFSARPEIRQPDKHSFSQFVALHGIDEFAISELVVHETFNARDHRQISLLGQPFELGSTEVSLGLVAHYKYAVRLSALGHQLDGDVLSLHVPALLLAQPVAFEFASVHESDKQTLLGPDAAGLQQQLRNEVSGELVIKGLKHMPLVYDRAARSLADNLNSFLLANGDGGFYHTIEVSFGNEKPPVLRRFNYNNSFCTPAPCKLELNVGKDRKLIIR